MALGRLWIALILAALAIQCALFTEHAVADLAQKKMIVLGSHFDQTLEVTPSFSARDGSLILEPRGSMNESVHVEILSSNGRSPASEAASARVLKRLTLSQTTSVQMAEEEAHSNSVIRIRILAP